MNKTSRKVLEAKIKRIVHITKQPMVLHCQGDMPGNRYRVESGDQSQDHSSLLKAGEMDAWLEGYEKALEMLRWEAMDEVSRRQHNNSFYAEQVNACSAEVIGCLFCPCLKCKTEAAERESSRRATMNGWMPR